MIDPVHVQVPVAAGSVGPLSVSSQRLSPTFYKQFMTIANSC